MPFFLSWKLGWWCLWELLLTWFIPLWTQTSDYAYQINFHLVQEFLKGFIDCSLIKITKGMNEMMDHTCWFEWGSICSTHVHTWMARAHKGSWCLFLCIKGLFRNISMLTLCGFLLRTLAWARMSLLSQIHLLSTWSLALHLLKHSFWELSRNHPLL